MITIIILAIIIAVMKMEIYKSYSTVNINNNNKRFIQSITESAEIIQVRKTTAGDEYEYYVHYKGCKCTLNEWHNEIS